MQNYTVNRMQSVSREELSWKSIFDLSVSGKHDLYSGHNIGYIRNELVKFKDSFDLEAYRNQNIEYEMTDGSKIDLTLDDSTIKKIRGLDNMHSINYAMVMDSNVPDYDYTPSGVKVGTFRDTLVDKFNDVVSTSLHKKKPARKWYNRFFNTEDTDHDVDYSVEIPTSSEVAQDMSDLYRRRTTTIDDTVHPPTFMPSDLSRRRAPVKRKPTGLFGLASRARSFLF